MVYVPELEQLMHSFSTLLKEETLINQRIVKVI